MINTDTHQSCAYSHCHKPRPTIKIIQMTVNGHIEFLEAVNGLTEFLVAVNGLTEFSVAVNSQTEFFVAVNGLTELLVAVYGLTEFLVAINSQKSTSREIVELMHVR